MPFYSLPWNQDTLVGYIGEIAYCCFVGEAYILSNGVILLLFVSICLHHKAFYQMYENAVIKLTEFDKNQNIHEYNNICDLVRFHVTIKT